MRKPDEAKLTDTNNYSWLSRTLSPRDVQPWPDIYPSAQPYVLGFDRGLGSLLSLNPVMEAWHYRTREEFAAVLTYWIAQAKEFGILDPGTVLVLPEYIGLFLYLTDEYPWVTRSSTLEMAGLWAMLDEKAWVFLSAFRNSWNRPYTEAVRGELMMVKARRAAEIYHSVLSTLAEQFQITIVGGSIPLPAPEIIDGVLGVGKGSHPLRDMTNVCAVFAPDGSIHPKLAVKKHPTRYEVHKLWITPRPEAETPLFETHAGRLAVLICADSWYADTWEAARGADVIAVPTLSIGSECWTKPWEGYDNDEEMDGLPQPAGETLEEAWRAHALLERIPSSGAKAGISSVLRGKIFDLETCGMPQTWHRDFDAVLPRRVAPPSLVKLWL